MTNSTRRISIDNGQTWHHNPETLDRRYYERDWDAVVALMDDDAREAAHGEFLRENGGPSCVDDLPSCLRASRVDFLRMYLRHAPEDLVIG